MEKLTINKEIYEDKYFYIFSQIYLIIMNTKDNFKNLAYDRLYQNMKKFSTANIKELNQTNYILREIFLFFSTLTKYVELQIKYEGNFNFNYDDKYEQFLYGPKTLRDKQVQDEQDNEKAKTNTGIRHIDFCIQDLKKIKIEKGGLKSLYFQIIPDGIFINSSDLEGFRESVRVDHVHKKQIAMMSYFNYVSSLIQVRKNVQSNRSSFFSAILKSNGKFLQSLSLFFSVLINTLILISIYYTDNNRVDPLHDIIFIFSLIHLLILGLFLSNLLWVEVYKFRTFNQIQGKKVTIRNYMKKYLVKGTFILVWNFFIGFAAIINPNMNFLYPLQLFSFFNVFLTMKSVLVSVQSKYKEFLSAGVLILILVLFYSLVSVVFFQDQFMNADLNVR